MALNSAMKGFHKYNFTTKNSNTKYSCIRFQDYVPMLQTMLLYGHVWLACVIYTHTKRL